jgi:hypothetical protein
MSTHGGRVTDAVDRLARRQEGDHDDVVVVELVLARVAGLHGHLLLDAVVGVAVPLPDRPLQRCRAVNNTSRSIQLDRKVLLR